MTDIRTDLIPRLKLFLALSRTPHGLLDMATPAFVALLWLGAVPPMRTVLLGMLTTFAGYTAVYALNDVIGYRSDRDKYRRGGFGHGGSDLDAVFMRHPMAQGALGFAEGTAWAVGWALVALMGAWALNPVCVAIFMAGCLLETVYCLLWRVSPFRAVVSGAVKTLGGVAAVFAVDPSPAPVFVTLVFLTLFFWEIGGQNVPNDLADVPADRRFGGKTIPVYFGADAAREIILWSIVAAVICTGIMMAAAGGAHAAVFSAMATAAAMFLLVMPCVRLYASGGAEHAMALFNQASYYPLSLLVICLIRLMVV